MDDMTEEPLHVPHYEEVREINTEATTRELCKQSGELLAAYGRENIFYE